MRWLKWSLVVVVLGVAGSALAYPPGCLGCNGAHGYRGLDAEAGAGPCGYAMVPGCCEDTRHCCDNAWAGYCEHRARVEAFWSHVGTYGNCGRGKACRSVAGPACHSCSATSEPIHPTPAASPRAASPRAASPPTPPAPTPLVEPKPTR